MVFSVVDSKKDQENAILEAEEDMVGVFSLRGFSERTRLSYTSRRIKADDANGTLLHLDKTITLPLPMPYYFDIIDAAQGYLLLEGWRLNRQFGPSLKDTPDILYFSLDPKTMLLEKKRIDPASPDAVSIFLADELLEEIFLRLASPADLARASIACASFRRIVTDRCFLRRYRSIHKPPLLGLLWEDFYPAEPPHSSAPAAQAVAQAADFKFSFLPSPGPWKVRDCRDGRVLVQRDEGMVVTDNDDDDEEGELAPIVPINHKRDMAELVICDSISRRYVIIPPIPDDLVFSDERYNVLVYEAFFAPAAEGETADTSFRVMVKTHYESKLVVFVFSSLTKEWSSSKSFSWSIMADDPSWFGSPPKAQRWVFPRYYAHGCFYWVINLMNKLLVLDTCKMVFFAVDFQSDLAITIMEAEEKGMIGLYALTKHSGRTHICYTTRRIEADAANGPLLNLDKTIPLALPFDYYFLLQAAQGYLLLKGNLRCWLRHSSEEDEPDTLYFSLEPKTLLLEKMSSRPEKQIHRASPAMGSIFLADEILEEVFLRLASPADLARASTACASFHRVAADFTFSFLPPGGRWMPRDCLEGRVLLARLPIPTMDWIFPPSDSDDGVDRVPFDESGEITDLAVCDPIWRRYTILPRIPEIETACNERNDFLDFETFLVPAGEDETDDTSFRVVARARYGKKLSVSVFSSRTGEWRTSEFVDWSVLDTDGIIHFFGRRQYAHGCVYWVLDWMHKLLIFDSWKMVFSIADIPRDVDCMNTAILEAEDGMVKIFTIRRDLIIRRNQLSYKVWRIKADGANGLRLDLDKGIPLPLPLDYGFTILGAAQGYLILRGFPRRHLSRDSFEVEAMSFGVYFSLDPNRLMIERVCELSNMVLNSAIYTDSLTSPPIPSPAAAGDAMSSPPEQRIRRNSPAPGNTTLADELLEEIFLRLASPADLVRASIACVAFRRVATDGSFLRRYRSIHKPPPPRIPESFYPAEAPHPSAATARALAQAADFTFSFLPPGHWVPRDCRDGRVLLARIPMRSKARIAPLDGPRSDSDDEDELVPVDERDALVNLAVCDPISRRYVILPFIMEHQHAILRERRVLLDFETFLAPAGEEEGMEDTSFRVMARAHYTGRLFIATPERRTFDFGSWSTLSADGILPADINLFPKRQYAHGCFYWVLDWMHKLLIFDSWKMVFSIADLPRDINSLYTAIVEAEDGMVGVFAIKRDTTTYEKKLDYTIRRIKADRANGQPLELDKTIPLPLDYNFTLQGAAHGYLILRGYPSHYLSRDSLDIVLDMVYFSLEPKRLVFEKGEYFTSQGRDIYRFSTFLVTSEYVNKACLAY
uniref:F-box domain-containing protein n=1 Tax=Leersia perrieri TaxID=77586 RepID=A0A0D9X091_9ORYZ